MLITREVASLTKNSRLLASACFFLFAICMLLFTMGFMPQYRFLFFIGAGILIVAALVICADGFKNNRKK